MQPADEESSGERAGSDGELAEGWFTTTKCAWEALGGGGAEWDRQAEDFPGLFQVSEEEAKGQSDSTGCQGVFLQLPLTRSPPSFFWTISQ